MNTVTQTVSHASDGSKTMDMACVFAIAATISGTYYANITASATVTLDTIPRASSVSMGTGTMGSASTITISRASSSFTHTLTYTFGSASGTIATKTTATSVSWTPPLTLANQIPNAASGSGTLTCTTLQRQCQHRKQERHHHAESPGFRGSHHIQSDRHAH